MPWHEFMTVDAKRFHPSDYMRFVSSPESNTVKLSDDVYMYMSDSFEWIPSQNPANQAEWLGCGLNQFGPTVILQDGSEPAKRVFSSWAQLFAAAPEEIQLTHGWEYSCEGRERQVRRFDLNRNETVEALRRIADLAAHVALGERFLLHLGI